MGFKPDSAAAPKMALILPAKPQRPQSALPKKSITRTRRSA
jgi:hypothetical protein